MEVGIRFNGKFQGWNVLMTSHLQVTQASPDHIPAILQLLEENLLANKKHESEEALINSGFINYRFSTDDVRAWILDPEFIVLVCKDADRIVGYSIGCNFETTPPRMQATLITAIEGAGGFNAKKIFYHKEIVTAKGGHGVGTAIMSELVERLKKIGFSHMVCIISEQPHHNGRSYGFHQKVGFKSIGSVQDKNKVDNVFLKKI